MPVLVVTEAESVRMNFLTHNLLQFFAFNPRSEISDLKSNRLRPDSDPNLRSQIQRLKSFILLLSSSPSSLQRAWLPSFHPRPSPQCLPFQTPPSSGPPVSRAARPPLRHVFGPCFRLVLQALTQLPCRHPGVS